jgi:hypothetical protein
MCACWWQICAATIVAAVSQELAIRGASPLSDSTALLAVPASPLLSCLSLNLLCNPWVFFYFPETNRSPLKHHFKYLIIGVDGFRLLTIQVQLRTNFLGLFHSLIFTQLQTNPLLPCSTSSFSRQEKNRNCFVEVLMVSIISL